MSSLGFTTRIASTLRESHRFEARVRPREYWAVLEGWPRRASVSLEVHGAPEVDELELVIAVKLTIVHNHLPSTNELIQKDELEKKRGSLRMKH